MSKRKREAVENAVLMSAAKPENQGSVNRWRKTSFQGKIIGAAIVVLIALAAFGATLKHLEADAKRRMRSGQLQADGTAEKSLLDAVNPFLANPTPIPPLTLSKEYVYAGSKLLNVSDANADAAPPTDLAVWRPDQNSGAGTWLIMGGAAGSQPTPVAWGANTDQPVPGDYDGDGKTDFSVFRPSNGIWYIQKSSDNALLTYQFGQNGDLTAPADYDGDGRTDAAVFRPSNGFWYIQRSSDSGLTAVQWGLSSDKTASADYDGDGKADIGVWRAADNNFYYLKSSQNNTAWQMITVGQGGIRAVPGDYDGDGKADAAVWGAGANQNEWHIVTSSGQTIPPISIGVQATDVPVQNDYDGDGKVDRAVWRPSNGMWYISQSTKLGQPDEYRIVQWGMTGDTPVPAFYRR